MVNTMGSLLLSLLMIFSQPVMAETEEDPWEGFNRAMFSFNDAIDGAVLKPVATTYKDITPHPVQKGVSNFFSNLGEISNITNNLLQGKWDETASSTWRFIINSTAGWFGIFDVASELGLKRYKEDFGQTLGYWGVSSGPYLVLPFLGPSTVRDSTGMVVDYTNYDAMELIDTNRDQRWGSRALDVVDTRARLLAAESLIIGDRYSFIRDIYFQTRINDVHDGNPPQRKAASNTDDDSWGEESEDDSWGDEDSWGDDSRDDEAGESSWAE
ncbi:MlaA family lipoprotein [Marinomonas transparens]|uniref:VacJ family lipoprotein n=1 Tax=Marinomonas transparens TaxID=2795388 RepID=A0A934JUN5_9GAMM|nr:VacJ family lipoprotein [Marinomonas transparens]MBJ7537619.1 VacJ family lipoprotein [Marinomonas transparens]